MAGCELPKDDAENDNSTTEEEVAETTDETVASESEPEIKEESVGGMPAQTEAATIETTTPEEVQTTANTLLNMSGALSLNLLSSSSASLIKGEGGGGCPQEAGMFCITTMFAMIFDMATGPANCNFKLLLKDPDGNDREPRKVEGKEIYFVDGFGTIGMGDNGVVQCPKHKTVFDWAKKVGLMKGGTISKPSENDDTFYPPTRLVIYKKADGKFAWKIVFFPSDFVDDIVKRVPFLKGIKNHTLDFVAYHGSHKQGEEVGKGSGDVTLDWDELHRMMEMFNSMDDEGEEEDDEGMPKGKIKVVYDMEDDPTHYTMSFLGDFSMGDGDLPFLEDTPVTVYKSSGENYLHFATSEMPGGDDEEEEAELIKSEEEEDEGPIANVQYCTKTDESQDGLFAEIKASSIAESQFLKDLEIHFQIIWKDLPDGEVIPDDYELSMLASGGPYIYGDVDLRAGRKDGDIFNGFRIKVPKCEALDADAIATYNAQMTTHMGKDVEIFDSEGYFIMGLDKFGSGASPTFTTAAKILEGFPTFTKFQLIDVKEEGATPVIE